MQAGDGSRSADGRTVADVGSRMPSIALFAFDVPCMAGVAMSDVEPGAVIGESSRSGAGPCRMFAAG